MPSALSRLVDAPLPLHCTPRQIRSPLLVQTYFRKAAAMAPSRVPSRAFSSDPAAGEIPIDAWPYLDEEVLKSSRSRQVCITCHWFRHHAGVNCIPLLTCQLHEGLISHGEHLTRRCSRWVARREISVEIFLPSCS